MSGVTDFIFGGSEDAKQTGTAQTLTPSQKDLLDQLTGMLGGQLGKGVEGYEGSTTGSSDIYNNLFKAMGGLMSEDSLGSIQQNPNALAAYQKLMGGADPASNQKVDVGQFDPAAVQSWYKDALVDPAMREWNDTIAPAVQEKFISQNAGSSGAANRAISKSAEDLMSGLNSQMANALYGEKQAFDNRSFAADSDYASRLFSSGQADVDRAGTAGGLALETSQQPFQQLMAALGMGNTVGASEYGVSTDAASGDYQQWLAQQGYNNPWLNMLPTALGTSAFSPIVQGPTQQSGLMQTIMGSMGGTDFSSLWK